MSEASDKAAFDKVKGIASQVVAAVKGVMDRQPKCRGNQEFVAGIDAHVNGCLNAVALIEAGRHMAKRGLSDDWILTPEAMKFMERIVSANWQVIEAIRNTDGLDANILIAVGA